ncbi:MFS transporter [Rhodobacteraceae bacterium N5(2021)]|uniref:MFS transporter n=1 Tax=Gymnodinialimonas phycosphaerae TaxID=2841589 RepID=A0ABS7MXB8_9RHOB|nr:MFS transporter [Gymnodinialimonas phycosphaerae]MBY4893750.1 MFS transporter [Gymnodinialimonas phycosphaerae]
MTVPRPRKHIVPALGLVQILTWGSTFYLLAVLGDPIVQATGWPRVAVTGGVSLGLLTSGLAARMVGREITARGGRDVMMAGVALLIVGLLGLAAAPSLPFYFAAWIVLGCGMAASLYEAAFSTLGMLFGDKARSAITTLTLLGGLASTICWPLSAYLVDVVGWRGTCGVYAALHLCVTLPLCRFGLPASPKPRVETAGPPSGAAPRLDLPFVCMALWGVSLALILGVISVHLITLLTAGGLSVAAAVALGAMIGPSQVAARLVELAGRGRHHPIITQFGSSALICLGLVGLWQDIPTSVCMVAYGTGAGLWSIARGTMVLQIYGARAYPSATARLARPVLIAAAVAPLAGGALIEAFGPLGTLRLLALATCVPLLATLTLGMLLRR